MVWWDKQVLEQERAEVERSIHDQQELQRQANDCLTYKTGRQAEQQLAQRIDQLEAQKGEVGLPGNPRVSIPWLVAKTWSAVRLSSWLSSSWPGALTSMQPR